MCRGDSVDPFIYGSGRRYGVGIEIVENGLRIDFGGRVCELVGALGESQVIADLTIAKAADGKAVDG